MTSTDHERIIESAYDAFAEGKVETVLAMLDPAVEWTEAAGFPYAGTYVGPDAVLSGVFARLGAEWDGYQAVPDRLVSSGDTVITTGTYSGTYRATGKRFAARFAHVFEFRAGMVCRFEQIVDSAEVAGALT